LLYSVFVIIQEIGSGWEMPALYVGVSRNFWLALLDNVDCAAFFHTYTELHGSDLYLRSVVASTLRVLRLDEWKWRMSPLTIHSKAIRLKPRYVNSSETVRSGTEYVGMNADKSSLLICVIRERRLIGPVWWPLGGGRCSAAWWVVRHIWYTTRESVWAPTPLFLHNSWPTW